MAITKHETSQPYLENLEPSEPNDYTLPSWDKINFEGVEFILDVDLDELDVFFEDKKNPYTVEEIADDYSLLIDMFEDRVVGVIVNQFYSRQLRHHPEFITALRYATIIAGDSVQEPPDVTIDHMSFDGKVISKRDAVAGVARLIGIK